MKEPLFCELKAPLDARSAKVESSRCYYCYDAPCIQACPTQIDIPSFIRKISNDNLLGAAQDILRANVMGGTCARVCPVEVLCQSACVRAIGEDKSVEIGRLQRFATDQFFESAQPQVEKIFQRAPANGKKIAVVGAGPAGLAAAHGLAVLGYDVTVVEARAKAGGLNEYGLAPYKVTSEDIQREVDWILGVGGIELRLNSALGIDFTLDHLRTSYHAVFLGLGLHAFRSLGIPGEDRDGVYDSARFIERIRQAPRVADLPVGRTVVVIGGGSTAIDIAIEMKQLGAESVTIVYRSAEEKMSATSHERELARNQGVVIRSHARPTQIFGKPNGSHSVEFERTDRCTGERFELHAEQVFKAIGQTLDMGQWWGQGQLHLTASGKIAVNEKFETSVPGVFAAGDCVASGDDLTVSAVQQGKLVAQAIHAQLNPMEKGEVNDGRSHLSDRGSEISQSFLAGFSTPNG